MSFGQVTKHQNTLLPNATLPQLGSRCLAWIGTDISKLFLRVIYANFGVNLDFGNANIVVNYVKEKFYNIGLET